jgi:iron complex transport system permease protein
VVAVQVAAAALAVAALVASVSLGEYAVPLADVLAALTGTGQPQAQAQLIVLDLRLPRAVTALLVGIAFGLSGALFQAVTRNPLASPDLIGVSAGASAGAVGAIQLAGVTVAGSGSYVALPVGALAGALLAAAVIYTMAYRSGTITGYRFVLVGLGVHAGLGALTAWLLAKADIDQASRAMVWLTGSLNGRDSEHAAWVALALATMVPVALALARPLQLAQLGDDTPRGLGLSVDRARVALLLTGVGLAAAATAAAGPVAFVALAAPQVARHLTRSASVPLLTSGCVGAVLMLGADLIARLVLAPVELPVGVVTGVVGAPYLMWLLARSDRVGRS